MKKPTPTYYHWATTTHEYNGLKNFNAEFIRGGYIDIEVEDSADENFSIPFVYFGGVWYQNPIFKYYDQFDEFSEDSDIDSRLDAFTFMEFKPDFDSNPISYYLAVHKDLETNPFIDLDGVTITSRNSNPSVDDSFLNLLLTSSYTRKEVEEIEFEFDFPGDPNPPSVPEPSAVSGMLVISVLILGVTIKRQISHFLSKVGGKC